MPKGGKQNQKKIRQFSHFSFNSIASKFSNIQFFTSQSIIDRIGHHNTGKVSSCLRILSDIHTLTDTLSIQHPKKIYKKIYSISTTEFIKRITVFKKIRANFLEIFPSLVILAMNRVLSDFSF